MKAFLNKIKNGYLNLVTHFKWTTVIIAFFLAIFCLLTAIFIDIFNISSESQELIQSLAIAFIPAFCTYIITTLFFNTFNERANQIQTEIIKEEYKNELVEITKSTRKTIKDSEIAIQKLLTSISLQEIEKVYYSYADVEWKKFLLDAEEISLCVFYMPEYWLDENLEAFSDFCNRGGILNIYLPSPIEVSNRYFEETEVNSKTEENILKTNLAFKKIHSAKIKMIKQGFNYMFARIIGKENYFLLSPYSNISHGGKAPTMLFNEKYATENLKQFIDKEVEFLEKANEFIELEKEKYIIWNTERNNVYVSTGLSCSESCKFCYAKSLVTKDELIRSLKIARCLFFEIMKDHRFKEGLNGTVIMLGGFNDPFHDNHFEASCYLIKEFEKYKNPIHVATRYTLQQKQLLLIPKNPYLVINYSISTFNDYRIEKNNQETRFSNAKALISSGYNVALFLRPVIKEKTLADIDIIISKIKDSKIKVVTVGGLYIDDRIQNSLKRKGVVLDNKDFTEKQFVLDDRKILKKIQIDDIDKICDRLEKVKLAGKNNLRVFKEARHRVDYYRNSLNKK